MRLICIHIMKWKANNREEWRWLQTNLWIKTIERERENQNYNIHIY